MVLDAKALTWASQNNLDTAKLKAAKVPIYGKWYFPEMPAGVRMINLETGERTAFDGPMVAGEVLWVPEAELRRAQIGPFASGADEVGAPPADARGVPPPTSERPPEAAAKPAEPLLAMTRPPRGIGPAAAAAGEAVVSAPADEMPPGVHLPRPSIAPFLVGVGFCILGLGVITSPFIFIVGLVWMVAGAIAWIRIGLLEQQDAQAHAVEHVEHTAPEGAS